MTETEQRLERMKYKLFKHKKKDWWVKLKFTIENMRGSRKLCQGGPNLTFFCF